MYGSVKTKIHIKRTSVCISVFHKNLDNRPVEAPGVYLHIDPEEIFIGGGLHMPMPAQLRAIRERIADEWKDLEAITKSPRFLE